MVVSLEEARAWLRLGAGDEDALVERLIDAATNICEAFTGQWLVEREGEEIVSLRQGVARIFARPVVAVDAVTLIGTGGSETVLDTAAYRVDIAGGAARVTVPGPAGEAQVRIAYRAGLAAAAEGVPAAIRHGVVRMIRHLYEARDREEASPPAAIAALWQPWRRTMLGAGQ